MRLLPRFGILEEASRKQAQRQLYMSMRQCSACTALSSLIEDLLHRLDFKDDSMAFEDSKAMPPVYILVYCAPIR